jgi:hypothetical protein
MGRTSKSKPQSAVRNNKFDTELNALYIERLERFMSLVELSYVLKNATSSKPIGIEELNKLNPYGM